MIYCIKCEHEGRKRPALYKINETRPNGKKVFIDVCEEHAVLIGDDNLERNSGAEPFIGMGED
jgi:hypothetical protein